MKLVHISDTHGTFPELPEGDFVVHSGDFLPNASRGHLEVELPFQKRWLENRIETIKNWLGDRTFLLCQGNHDFIDACKILKQHEIDAIDLTNKVVVYQGISFYGFPFIPYICGEWNHEKHLPEMSDELRYMVERIKDSGVPLDILVAHAPPYGICDIFAGQHLGNSVLTNMINYQQLSSVPKYIFCGHIHHNGDQSSGELDGIIISQAATRVHVIDYDVGTR